MSYRYESMQQLYLRNIVCASAKRRIVKIMERMGKLERMYFLRAVAARTQWELKGANYWMRQLRG